MAMKDGMKNYRNMMKRMEKGMGEEKIPASENMGMESMTNLDSMGRENIPARMDMGLDSMMPDDEMMKMSKQGTGNLSSQELKFLENMLGTTVTDEGSGGNNGTLINGTSFSTDVP